MKILAPEVVESGGQAATAEPVVGTGAFVLQNE